MSNPVVRLKDVGLSYHRIASMIFDQPLLIRQQELQVMLDYLGPRMGFQVQETSLASASGFGDEVSQFEYTTSEHGYKVYGDIAVVEVFGKLIHRGDWMDSLSGLVSYNSLEAISQKARNDPKIEEIWYVYDTPGGSSAGAFDTADYLHEISQIKPTKAIISELAASGGFLMASTANEIVLSRTSEVGHVGVVTAHLDMSKAMKQAGKAVTLIYAGSHKVDGNPYNPLPEEVKEAIQERIDKTYSLFTSTVARNLSISEEAVRETQALVYTGSDAIDVGFAHRIGTLSSELNAHRPGGRSRPKPSQNREKSMSNTETPKQDLDAAKEQGRAEGMKSQKERFGAVLGSEHSKGRETLANHLLSTTDLSADAIISTLQVSPVVPPKVESSGKTEDANSETSFEKHMKKTASDVGDGGAPDEKSKTEQTARDDNAKSIASFYSGNRARSLHSQQNKENL